MTYAKLLREARRKILLDALDKHGWCVAKAARALRINRTDFYKKMHEARISPPHFANRGNDEWRALQ